MFARIIIAISLASAAAAAEQPKPPKPQPQVVCTYGKTRFEALPDGRTVIIMGKVCVEVSR